MLQTKKADFNGLAEKLGVSPVSVRIMRNRGLETEEAMYRYLYGTVDELYDGSLMTDMEKAVGTLVEKMVDGKKIRIIGDYDIDGVCSTYLLLTGLRRAAAAVWENSKAGAECGRMAVPSAAEAGNEWNIDYEIPDRIKDGYGINESLIRQAAEDGVDTIITCDNGISASKEIALARELGMTVIVTDHHEVPVGEDGQILPPANAVVNPKRDGDRYPFPEICGAVVAYKLIRVLYKATGVADREWKELLEFAAIATVGDVMKLQDENRIIVKYGLRRMAVTKNLGLRKLVEKTGLDITALSAYHIGFVIGPCLNASGRLQTAKIALRLLLSKDEGEADMLAEELKSLNDIRKDMTKQGEDAAIQ
ncbi:MAG: DHH family phosphoesterase, partial [Clostridium sp.]|nr:DHH family phosphoesterase [Clostridium sp.]